MTYDIDLARDRGSPHLHPCLLCPEHHWSGRKCSHNKHCKICCSTYATAVLARAQKVLGNDSVELLGPSTILLKNNFTLANRCARNKPDGRAGWHMLPSHPPLQWSCRIPTQCGVLSKLFVCHGAVGTATTRFENAVSICFTDNFAPGENAVEDMCAAAACDPSLSAMWQESVWPGRACSDVFAGNQDLDPPVPAPEGSDTPWWVWLLVGVAGLVTLALAVLLLLLCLRRRRRRQAARQLVLAPPAHKARSCAQQCLSMVDSSGVWCSPL